MARFIVNTPIRHGDPKQVIKAGERPEEKTFDIGEEFDASAIGMDDAAVESLLRSGAITDTESDMPPGTYMETDAQRRARELYNRRREEHELVMRYGVDRERVAQAQSLDAVRQERDELRQRLEQLEGNAAAEGTRAQVQVEQVRRGRPPNRKPEDAAPGDHTPAQTADLPPANK